MGYRLIPMPLVDSAKSVYIGRLDRPHKCGDCGKPMSERARAESLWGRCRECENERMRDVVAG